MKKLMKFKDFSALLEREESLITELNFSPRGFVGDFDKLVLDMKSVLANFLINLKKSPRDIQRDFSQLYSSFRQTSRKLSQQENEKIVDVLEPIITKSGFRAKLKIKDLTLCFLTAMSQTKNLEDKIPDGVLESLGDDELFEGGAYGHLSHPFEDMNLTMADVHQMIKATVEGAFGPENFVQEKTDGQQLSISWKNGQLIAARNQGHMKNAGENAMTIQGVADLYAGRGDIETVYNAAMEDLNASISALSDEDKLKFFDEGKKFASMEIITPLTQNTVPYGLNMLVFHGVLEYDENAKVIGEDKQAGRDLGRLIKDANAAAQKTFFVRGPQDMDIKPLPNTKARANYYEKKYREILKDCDLSEASTVLDYALGMGRKILLEEADSAKVTIPEEALDGLAKRIADIDKSFSVGLIKKTLGEDADWYINLEKKSAKDLKARVYSPLESLFLEVGTEFMKNMSAFLSKDPTAAAEEMKSEIDKTIATIRTNGDADEVEKLERQLARVTAAGGLDSIVPTEGITFVYKGKLYKYTGIFAPIHQIRSILAYKK